MRNMSAPTTNRPDPVFVREPVDEPRAAGFVCTVGRSRIRHAALLIPDERGLARLVPACGIGVSLREPVGRVLPYWFSNVITCSRGGCMGHEAVAVRRAPRFPQLELDLFP